jgi:3-hydroxyisobutyrate dehydrogenase-like beta-hydroxyacid dehydrogenase
MTDTRLPAGPCTAEPGTTVAVLGTGIMGSAVARNLAAARLCTKVWDRSSGATVPLSKAGALVAGSPQAAVAGVRMVITMLPTARAVESAWRTAVEVGHARQDISAARLALGTDLGGRSAGAGGQQT